MYDVTITYVDLHETVRGKLYSAGYPLRLDPSGITYCQLCSNPVTDQGPNLDGSPRVATRDQIAAGEHLGFLADGDELYHWRCALDMVEMGSLKIVIGA
jgi:hypothetical protein